MYPEEVVDQLRKLQGRYLHETDTGYLNLGVLENAPVKKYRTGLTDPRIVIRSALNKFLARKAADPKSSVFEMGETEWVMYCSDPIYYISDRSILRVLTGKGTVEEIKDVLKIVSLMLQEQKPNKALRGCGSLRQFVDDYVGHDCNGFVFVTSGRPITIKPHLTRSAANTARGFCATRFRTSRNSTWSFPPTAATS